MKITQGIEKCRSAYRRDMMNSTTNYYLLLKLVR